MSIREDRTRTPLMSWLSTVNPDAHVSCASQHVSANMKANRTCGWAALGCCFLAEAGLLPALDLPEGASLNHRHIRAYDRC